MKCDVEGRRKAALSEAGRILGVGMSLEPSFLPVSGVHSIERCSISVQFSHPVPPKIFRNISRTAQDSAASAGFMPAKGAMQTFKIDGATGIVKPLEEDEGIHLFSSSDETRQFIMDPTSINWTTTRYIRWKPFVGQFETFSEKILKEYLDATSIKCVQIEYWDRFNWTGDWSTFRALSLFRPDCKFIPSAAIEFNREWHNHMGWFSQVDRMRRLTQINIDIIEVANNAFGSVPSVGIHSLVRDEAGVASVPDHLHADDLGIDFSRERLEKLHLASKSLLMQLICESVANQIGLES